MTTKNKSTDDCVGKEFTITREFAAPRELVFKACTDPGHLAQWWGPKGFSNPVCEWDARPGGKIFVVMRGPDGTDYPMGGEVREVVAPEKLVTVTGALDEKGDFLFEILHTMTLVERDGKTKLTMRSRVISATANAGRYIGGFEMGMTLSLERLSEHLAQKTEPFVIERTFNAPASLVWKAISNKDDMKQWYFDLAEFKPEPGFEFEFTVEHKGMNYHHRCKITDVIPQKRLAYTWRYEGHPGDSLVSFELHAEGGKTRLRLTHTGLETFPPLPSFARENFVMGWTQLIGASLKEYVEKKLKPNLFMTAKNTLENALEIKRFIDAPRERVFAAWTRPEERLKWFGDEHCACLSVAADVQVGGQWQIRMRSDRMGETEFHGVYLSVKPPAKLVYTWCWKNHSLLGTGETLVTVDFLELDGGTEIHLRHEGFPNVELCNRHTEGWGGCIEKLERWLQKAECLCQK